MQPVLLSKYKNNDEISFHLLLRYLARNHHKIPFYTKEKNYKTLRQVFDEFSQIEFREFQSFIAVSEN